MLQRNSYNSSSIPSLVLLSPRSAPCPSCRYPNNGAFLDDLDRIFSNAVAYNKNFLSDADSKRAHNAALMFAEKVKYAYEYTLVDVVEACLTCPCLFHHQATKAFNFVIIFAARILLITTMHMITTCACGLLV